MVTLTACDEHDEAKEIDDIWAEGSEFDDFFYAVALTMTFEIEKSL